LGCAINLEKAFEIYKDGANLKDSVGKINK